VNELVKRANGAATLAGWWRNADIHNDFRVVPTALCLIHSEISEAMEAHRKGLMDDHLPKRTGLEVELADAMIRIADLAGQLDIDLGSVVAEKMDYNARRSDHKKEERQKAGGKTY